MFSWIKTIRDQGLTLSKNDLVKGERGEYRLQSKISEGGMGYVWEAKSTWNGRRVVVKESHARGNDGRLSAERLRFEADVLRYLNDDSETSVKGVNQQLIQTNVVRYVDRAEAKDDPILVLEFVDGPTLNNTLRQPWPEKTCLDHVSTLLKAVTALHSKGIIHRDISPRNIILNAERGFVLIDFGTSLLIRNIPGVRNPRGGEVIFKRGFSSPELLHGRSDERSDVFSIGAILFFLLTGKTPADFMTSSQVLKKAACELDPRISRQASGIVQAAMAPDPGSRFASPTQMLTAIEDLQNPIPSSGAKVTFGRTSFPVTHPFTEIGREHVCDRKCRSQGFSNTLHIPLADPRKYIEKHHARILALSGGRYVIEDLGTVNGTAVKSGTGRFRVLAPLERVELHNGDIVALAYNPNRGPYVTFEFIE